MSAGMSADPGTEAVSRLHRALLDAARTRLGADVQTVDLHLSFLQPAAGPLAASARVTGGGRSVCFCEGELADERGVRAAQAMGTFRARRVVSAAAAPGAPRAAMSDSANAPGHLGDCATAPPPRDCSPTS